MKTVFFDFKHSSASDYCLDHAQAKHVYVFDVPVLPAYAIEYFVLDIGMVNLYEGDSVWIENDKLHFHAPTKISESGRIRLLVHYQGIRDYSLLFPLVSDESLRARLGQFYEESEAAFASASWLSFTLMCGAIFEGMLYSKLGMRNDSFNNMIDEAFASGIIDKRSKEIMHKTRGYRNRIHGNRHAEDYVSRADAMDTRVVLDKLVVAG